MPTSRSPHLRRHRVWFAALAVAIAVVACFSPAWADDLPHAYLLGDMLKNDGERDITFALTRDGRQCLRDFDGLPGEQIFDTRSGALVGAFPFGYPIAYSPEGKRVICQAGVQPDWHYESTNSVICDFPSGAHPAPLPQYTNESALRFTSDGRQILCATEKRQTDDDRQPNPGIVLETYDAATGKLLRSVFLTGSKGHRPAPDSLVFSANGRYVLFRGDFDGAWPGAIWSTEDGHLVKEGTPSDADFRVESISDDGRYWVTMGENLHFKMPENAFGEAARARRLTYRLWDAHTGKQLHVFPGTDANFIDDRFPPRFTPDSRTIYHVGGQGALEFWDIATHKVRRSVGRSDEPMVALSADRSTLVTETGYRTGQATVYDVATGRVRHFFAPPPPPPVAVCWSPDGRYLASAGEGAVQLWDLRGACLVRSVARDTDAYRYTLRFADANRLTLCSDTDAYTYSVPDLKPIGPVKGVPLPQPDYKGLHLLDDSPFGVSIEDLIRAPDGKTMVLHLSATNSADRTEKVLVLDRMGKHILRTLADPSSDISQAWNFARYLPDSVHFVIGAKEGIRIFNLDTGEWEKTLVDPNPPPTPPPANPYQSRPLRPPFYAPFVVSPSGSLLLGGNTYGDNQPYPIWRVSDGAIVQRVTPSGDAQFSPDEHWLAESSDSPGLLDWRTGAITKLPRLTPADPYSLVYASLSSPTIYPGNLVWSPDGTRFAIRQGEGICVWRIPAEVRSAEGGASAAPPALPVTLSFGGGSASAPNWLVEDTLGHYNASPLGEKRLFYRPDGSDRLFPAAQFKAQLLRPNLLGATLAGR